MYKLSQKQAQAYQALEDAWLIDNRQPNLTELAQQLGIHYVTLRQHLNALETKGYLSIETKGSGRPPVIHLTQLYLEAA